MSSMARDAIIKAFMTMPEITVFLVSLKVSKPMAHAVRKQVLLSSTM